MVLGLGNDLLADDGVGLAVADSLRNQINGRCDVITTAEGGVGLLDYLIGYNRAILIDAVTTGRACPGTVHVWSPDDIGAVAAPSPHYAGIPELFVIARQLQLDFPTEMVIFGIEVADVVTVGGDMGTAVTRSISRVVDRVKSQLDAWG